MTPRTGKGLVLRRETDAIEAQGNILLMHPAGAVKIDVAECWQGDMLGEVTRVQFHLLLSSTDATLSRRPTPLARYLQWNRVTAMREVRYWHLAGQIPSFEIGTDACTHRRANRFRLIL